MKDNSSQSDLRFESLTSAEDLQATLIEALKVHNLSERTRAALLVDYPDLVQVPQQMAESPATTETVEAKVPATQAASNVIDLAARREQKEAADAEQLIADLTQQAKLLAEGRDSYHEPTAAA